MIDSYIIGSIRKGEGGTAHFLGKVEAIKKGIVYGVKAKDAHVKELRSGFEIPERDVVICLGANPVPGKVYGQDVSNLFVGRRVHDFFGPVCFMYKPDKAVSRKLWDAFDSAAAKLQKAKLPSLTTSVWEVQSAAIKTKWAGYYVHSKKPEKNPHRFAIRPDSVPMTTSDMEYLILHEYSHWVHANLATGKQLNAKWVRLFNTSIKLQTIEREHSMRLLRQLVGGEEPPSDFRGQLEENDANAFNWIMRTIKANHSLSVRELDLLFAAGYKADLEAVWPKNRLNKKDLHPVVSEYATMNFEELFAESLAFHFTKRSLPESVTKLVLKTIEFASANSMAED